MQKPRLIGFTGLKGSGKDTSGSVFVDHDWLRVSFAEPLKDMLKSLLVARGCPDPERYTDGDKKEVATSYLMGRTARHAMQTLGTEWGRTLIDGNLWIDTFKRRVNTTLLLGDSVVVTDIRFLNEVEAIKDLGGVVFRIERPALDGRTFSDAHASETQVGDLPVDGVIVNSFPTAHDFRRHIEARFF